MLSRVVPKIISKHSGSHCVFSVTKSQFLVWGILLSCKLKCWKLYHSNHPAKYFRPFLAKLSDFTMVAGPWPGTVCCSSLRPAHNQAATCARNSTIKIHPAQSYAFYLTENSNFVIYLCKLYQQPFGLFANCILFENQNLYILTMLISDYNLLYVLGHHCLSPLYW